MVDGYAAERRYSFTVENAGLRMTYEGTHRPLAAYFDLGGGRIRGRGAARAGRPP